MLGAESLKYRQAIQALDPDTLPRVAEPGTLAFRDRMLPGLQEALAGVDQAFDRSRLPRVLDRHLARAYLAGSLLPELAIKPIGSLSFEEIDPWHGLDVALCSEFMNQQDDRYPGLSTSLLLSQKAFEAGLRLCSALSQKELALTTLPGPELLDLLSTVSKIGFTMATAEAQARAARHLLEYRQTEVPAALGTHFLDLVSVLPRTAQFVGIWARLKDLGTALERHPDRELSARAVQARTAIAAGLAQSGAEPS